MWDKVIHYHVYEVKVHQVPVLLLIMHLILDKLFKENDDKLYICVYIYMIYFLKRLKGTGDQLRIDKD